MTLLANHSSCLVVYQAHRVHVAHLGAECNTRIYIYSPYLLSKLNCTSILSIHKS